VITTQMIISPGEGVPKFSHRFVEIRNTALEINKSIRTLPYDFTPLHLISVPPRPTIAIPVIRA